MGDGLARSAILALVRDRARADDAARAERAGLGGVGDQIGEGEGRVLAHFGAAEGFAIVIDGERQMDHAVLPGVAQLVGGDADRREGARGLGLEEAEALGELAGDQPAQTHVVDQHQQLDVAGGIGLADAHRHIVGDAGDLAFHVAAPGGIAQRDIGARGQEAVAPALIHQRVVVEAVGHLGVARLADQFDVVDIGRAIGPLIGARQRRMRLALVEALAGHALVLDIGIEILQLGRAIGPVVERGLQRGGDVVGRAIAGEVLRDDDQFPVAGSVVHRGEFHLNSSRS